MASQISNLPLEDPADGGAYQLEIQLRGPDFKERKTPESTDLQKKYTNKWKKIKDEDGDIVPVEDTG